MKVAFNLGNASQIAVFIAIFFLPIKTTLSNFGIFLLLGTTLISFFLKGVDLKIFESKKFWLGTPLILFIPFIIGLAYTDNYGAGLDDLRRCVFYVLLPFVLLRKDLSKEKTLRTAAFALICGSVLSMTFLLATNLYKYFGQNPLSGSIFAYNYTGILFAKTLKDMHPVYLGSYFLMSLAILLFGGTRINRGIKISILLLIFPTLVFLSSRIVFLATLVLLAVYWVIKLDKKLKTITAISALIAVVFLGFLFKETYVYNKLVNGVKWELTQNVNTNNLDTKRKSDSRMSRWTAAYNIFYETPFLGHGAGTEKSKLIQYYDDKDMQISKENEYNAHNQFLGYAIEFGTIGLFFCVTYFFVNFKMAFIKRDYCWLAYVAIVFSCCLTENYLIRNMGVNFVAIFGVIFHLKDEF